MPALPRKRPLLLPAVIAVALTLVVALALTVGGGWNAFRQWRAGRFVRQAQEFLGTNDLRHTVFAATRAHQLDPENANAPRVLAEAHARAGQGAESLRWWREVIRLQQPAATPDRLAFAATALQFDAPADAASALAGVPAAAQAGAEWQSLAGALALRQGHPGEAAAHFTEAARQEPNNLSYALNAASLRLQAAPDDPTARATLTPLAAGNSPPGPLRIAARRALFNAAAVRGDRDESRQVGRQLETDEQATLDDRLAVVGFLFHTPGAQTEAATALDRLLADAARERRPEPIANLLAWMRGAGLAETALTWARRLPRAALADGRQVQPALAACLAAVGDWTGLKTLCAEPGANWAENDPLRHAALARALEATGDHAASGVEWTAATVAALRYPPAARALAGAVRSWGGDWDQRLGASLENATADPDPAVAGLALELLADRAHTAGNTRAMAGFIDRLAVLHPADPATRNNRAALALLLHDSPPLDAVAEARALHAADPLNPGIATTHAFALLRQGDPVGARQVLEALLPEQLATPDNAAYYGLVLAAAPAGPADRERAAQFLARAKTAPLLPEERALVDHALQSLKP